jgi:hypothetical protein
MKLTVIKIENPQEVYRDMVRVTSQYREEFDVREISLCSH